MDPTKDAQQPTPESLKDQLDYALKHFLFIADQRIKTFNFYVILLAATGGATVQFTTRYDGAAFVSIGFFHLLVAAVFCLIEQRNIRLLKICKRALVQLEGKRGWPIRSRLATIDDRVRSAVFSYRGAINIAFAAQALIGLALLYCALCVRHHSAPDGPMSQKNATSAQKAENRASPVMEKESTSSISAAGVQL